MGSKWPAKSAPATAENLRLLYDGLTSIIAGHAHATSTYLFYEEVDAYLGPWGEMGYPIAYGKYYNIKFSTDEALLRDATGKQWMWKTLIYLQELLRDYIVAQFKMGKLAGVTEKALRDAAFESHPKAYTDAGLAMVALASPALLIEIASIPGKEFNPFGDTFGATVKQVIEAGAITAVQAGAIGMMAIMPAHSQIFQRARSADQRTMARETQLMNWLANISAAAKTGILDHFEILSRLTGEIDRTEYSDQQMGSYAGRVCGELDERKRLVAARLRNLARTRPELKAIYDRTQPGWSNW